MDYFNTLKGLGGGIVDAAIDQYTKDLTVNFDRFMLRTNTKDLSRSNLFLVRFGDFESRIKGDGIISGMLTPFEELIGAGNIAKLGSFGHNKIIDMGQDVIMGSQIGKKLLGAVSPHVLRSLIPGEILDGVISDGEDLNRDIAMMARTVNLPDQRLSVVKSTIDKLPFHSATGKDAGVLSIEFYLSPSRPELHKFSTWMNSVFNQETQEVGFYDAVSVDIEVYNLDRTGAPRAITQCTGCYPIGITQSPLSVDSDNEISTVSVEFCVASIKSQRFNPTPMNDAIANAAGQIGSDLFNSIRG